MPSPKSALELVDASLAANADHGVRTNAFIALDADGARAAARAVDEEKRRGIDRGPLHGMPISIKDLIDVAGQPTTAASNARPARVLKRSPRIRLSLRSVPRTAGSCDVCVIRRSPAG